MYQRFLGIGFVGGAIANLPDFYVFGMMLIAKQIQHYYRRALSDILSLNYSWASTRS